MKCRKVSHLVSEFPKFQFPTPRKNFGKLPSATCVWVYPHLPPFHSFLYYFVKCIFITGNVKQHCWEEGGGDVDGSGHGDTWIATEMTTVATDAKWGGLVVPSAGETKTEPDPETPPTGGWRCCSATDNFNGKWI